MPLTNADPHHWAPVPEIVNHLAEKYKGKRVLEIGPGDARFPAATHFVDFRDLPGIPPEQLVKLDVNREHFPVSWCGYFDFVYCRHLVEDMWNPFWLLGQMSYVGKAGYIETPSPLCEFTRGVDGKSPAYRGYNHHRWFIWDHDDRLNFITKFPLVEYLSFADESVTEQLLRSSPRYWNTYFLWEGDIKFSHLQCHLDFGMPQDYGAMLVKAQIQSKASIDTFWKALNG